MNKWDRDRLELDNDLESGNITYEEYIQYNREINWEEDEFYARQYDSYRDSQR